VRLCIYLVGYEKEPKDKLFRNLYAWFGLWPFIVPQDWHWHLLMLTREEAIRYRAELNVAGTPRWSELPEELRPSRTDFTKGCNMSGVWIVASDMIFEGEDCRPGYAVQRLFPTDQLLPSATFWHELAHSIGCDCGGGQADYNTIHYDHLYHCGTPGVKLSGMCYSEDTEILTRDGWKHFCDLTFQDEIATVKFEETDVTTGKLEYHHPERIIELDWDGPLIVSEGKTVRFAVTPDNEFLVIEHMRNTPYKIVRRTAASLKTKKKNIRFPDTVRWNGNSPTYFTLPGQNPLQIPFKDWLRFLGIYLAEGSVDKYDKCRVDIAQNKADVRSKIRRLLKQLPWNFKEEKGRFRIYSKQLASYLSKFGRANEKYIPRYVAEAKAEDIAIFLNWFIAGDGYINKDFPKEHRYVYTTSKRLADGIQELMIKIGRSASIRKKCREQTNFTRESRPLPLYIVTERTSKTKSTSKGVKEIWYTGKVYDVTVPNGTIIIRKDGHTLITSNCPQLNGQVYSTGLCISTLCVRCRVCASRWLGVPVNIRQTPDEYTWLKKTFNRPYPCWPYADMNAQMARVHGYNYEKYPLRYWKWEHDLAWYYTHSQTYKNGLVHVHLERILGGDGVPTDVFTGEHPEFIFDPVTASVKDAGFLKVAAVLRRGETASVVAVNSAQEPISGVTVKRNGVAIGITDSEGKVTFVV